MSRYKSNLITLGFLLMLISNFVLILILYQKDTTTVLVPSIENEFVISSKFASKDYLKLRALEVHQLLFGMNRENASKIRERLVLCVDNKLRSKFVKQVDTLIEDIKQKDYHYSFSDITEYAINTKDYQVKISGYLETFIDDSRVSKEHKTYLYEFINRGGLILLYSFKEVRDDS